LATPENLIKRGTWAETEDAPEFAGEVWAAAEKTKAKKLTKCDSSAGVELHGNPLLQRIELCSYRETKSF
jgi:hypothetical protein